MDSESSESTPVFGLFQWKIKKKLFYFLVWNLNWNWNWNWDGSWNDLRECQKLWGGLCILYCSYRGGFAPCISTVQNTQASPDFLTLPQFIPTCYKCYKRKKNFYNTSKVDLSLKTSCWNLATLSRIEQIFPEGMATRVPGSLFYIPF